MKTISLTESAYQRLVSWKEGQTFSEVIERMISPKGTIQAVIEAASQLPELSPEDYVDLEKVVNTTRQQIPSEWN